MVERWVASSRLLTEEHSRKVVGFRDFWALSVILGRGDKQRHFSSEGVVIST
jgi:hypothetical protein